MIISSKADIMGKGAVVAYVTHIPRITDENHQRPQTGKPVSELITTGYLLNTSQIQ
jgi:hypothetical protein